MLKKMKKNKGFTLVELLVVIAIIGILAVVAVPSLFKNINKAKAADIIADYSAIKAAVTSEYADGNLQVGIYTNSTEKTTLSNGDVKLDIQDLSKEAEYSLNVLEGGLSATLTITTRDEDIAKKVAKDIGGTPQTDEKVVKVDILKVTK